MGNHVLCEHPVSVSAGRGGGTWGAVAGEGASSLRRRWGGGWCCGHVSSGWRQARKVLPESLGDGVRGCLLRGRVGAAVGTPSARGWCPGGSGCQGTGSDMRDRSRFCVTGKRAESKLQLGPPRGSGRKLAFFGYLG